MLPKEIGFPYVWHRAAGLVSELEMAQISSTTCLEGTIDDAALELERMGSGETTALRTAALRAYGNALQHAFVPFSPLQRLDKTIEQICIDDPFLAAHVALTLVEPILGTGLSSVTWHYDSLASLKRRLRCEDTDEAGLIEMEQETLRRDSSAKRGLHGYACHNAIRSACVAVRNGLKISTSYGQSILAVQSLGRMLVNRSNRNCGDPTDRISSDSHFSKLIRDYVIACLVGMPPHYVTMRESL